jgi:tetratricopeptide (TPR) repeat protein
MRPINKYKRVHTRFILGILFLVWLGTMPGFAQNSNKDFLLGTASFIQGDYKAAAEYFSELINKNPGNIDFLNARANCYYKDGKFDQAIVDLHLIDKVKPGTVNFQYAQCFARIGNQEKAIQYLRLYLQSPNKKPESEIKLDKAFINMDGTNAWKNLWSADWYSSLEQSEAEVRYMLKSGENLDALEKLNSLVNRNKNRHSWYAMRAEAFSGLKDEKNAIKDLDKAISLNKHNPEYFKLRALLFIQEGKPQKAAEDFSKALKLDPSQLLLYKSLALSQEQAGDAGKGRENINLYIELFPRDAEGFQLAGKIEYDLDHYKEAINQLNKAITLDNSKPSYFYYRGLSYLEMLKYQDAINDLAQALDLDPDYAEAWYRKGMARLYKGDAEGACLDLKQAGHLGHKDAFNKAQEICNP